MPTQNVYLVKGYRTAVAKAPRGGFRFVRPDDLAVRVIKHLLDSLPGFDPKVIDDLIVGNAIPEGEQGLNIARLIGLASLPQEVAAVTVNRYCASGLETLAMAHTKIALGHADAIIAGGTETMSLVPMGGYKVSPNYTVAKEHPTWYFGMGLTAEAVAQQYNVSREDSDQFSLTSHQRALAAIAAGKFKDEIVPVAVDETYLKDGRKATRTYTVDTDEGPRADTTLEALGRLKPAFTAKGVVTAGNSSQTSDGAAFMLVASESIVKQFNLQPVARLAGYGVAGVDPKIMGIGPVAAIPKALKNAGISLNDIAATELNEAFASQSLAVIRELGLNPETTNPNGGAIALGHPLGCSGTKLTVQVINEVKRRGGKYGLVSACVGGGQGIAGVIEVL